MASPDHLSVLKRGVEAWNAWRTDNPSIVPDLEGAEIVQGEFRGANFQRANLISSVLRGTNLRDANLREANLTRSNLRGAYLRKADLRHSILRHCNLVGTNLIGANCDGADFDSAICWDTFFVAIDLSRAHSLERCFHRGPSTIDRRTLALSGELPGKFLQGCGLAAWEIDLARLYSAKLRQSDIAEILRSVESTRSTHGIQLNSLFISYSHSDRDFVDCIGTALTDAGIVYWRDLHDAPAGPLEHIVTKAIEQNPVVLLVLSKNSVESDWVEFEAQEARKLERRLKRHVLCPVALDDHWKNSAWSAVLRTQIVKYNVLDFSNWRDSDLLTRQFYRLLSGLALFYSE